MQICVYALLSPLSEVDQGLTWGDVQGAVALVCLEDLKAAVLDALRERLFDPRLWHH